MKITIELITPEIAKQILANNSVNRQLKPHTILDYTRQMSLGLWNENTGESIKIAVNNQLLDGQHRLYSLIKANVSLKFMVIRELDNSIFSVIDTGTKRTCGDALSILGVSQYNNIAAGIKKYTLLLNNMKGIRSSGWKNIALSNTEVIEIYSKRKSFWDESVKLSHNCYSKSSGILSQSDFLGYYAFFYDKDKSKASIFITSLADGSNLNINSPIRILRSKLLASKMNTKLSLLPSIKNAYVIKCWNAFKENKDMSVLRFDPNTDNYPIAL